MAQRVAFKMQLFPGKTAEYKKRHHELWPELAALLKNSGISDYHIFLDEKTNSLFGTYLSANPEALKRLPDNPIMKRWWAYMAELMESNADNSPVSISLEEMFYLP